MNKIATVSLIAFVAAFFSVAALAEPPHIRTGGTKTKWNQKTCLRNVEKAVRSVGFDNNLDVDNDDVEANKGNYSTETICWKNRYFFVIVAGPDFNRAGKLRNNILSEIRNMQ